MKKQLFILSLLGIVFLTGCTSAYKVGQTPDDVYYSPERTADEYWSSEDEGYAKYEYVDDYYDDRFLRMRVRNRRMWSQLDDWYYFGNRYSNVYYQGYWNNPWTPHSYWNTWYNPYFTGGHYYSPVIVKNNTYRGPRKFNLSSYNDNAITNRNYTKQPNNSKTFSNSGNQNRRSNSGSALRNIFGNNNSNNRSSNSNIKQSNNSSRPSSSSTAPSRSGSSGGGSAPARRF